jgi:hypothetical protein
MYWTTCSYLLLCKIKLKVIIICFHKLRNLLRMHGTINDTHFIIIKSLGLFKGYNFFNQEISEVGMMDEKI